MATRFVVLCHARTGSTLLGSLLAAHPQIRWGDEHFKTLRRQARRSLRRRLAHLVAYWLPAPYLNRQARRLGRPAYGCKLMPHYVAAVEQAVPALQRQDWRIIWLQRRDVLTGAVSRLVAAAGGHWITRPRQPSPAAPALRIEPAELLTEIRRRLQLDAREERCVAGLPHLRVVYEDDLVDAACWPATTERAFAYLRLSSVPVRSTVQKTWRHPYPQIVANYAELIEAVRSSELASVLSYTSGVQPANWRRDEDQP